jgi:hypothetical protein
MGGIKTARRADIPKHQHFKGYAMVNSWLKKAVRIFGAILINGLIGEYEGHQNETRILDSDNAVLYADGKRTALIAEDLRKENDLLESEIQPRRIKPEKRIMFLKLRGLQEPKCHVIEVDPIL